MIETTLVKRGALYKGEVGLYPTNEMAASDLALFPYDEVLVRLLSEANLQQLKFIWALANKIADNSDRYLDKDEAMEDLKRILTAREPLYRKADVTVDTTGETAEQSLGKLHRAAVA